MAAPPNEDTDEDLIEYMAMKSDVDGARGAWRTFYGRHARFVYNAIMKRWGDVFTTTTVDDLVAETMVRAFERAETYDPSKCPLELEKNSHSSPEEAERAAVRRVRAWLMGIARNLVRDAFGAESKIPKPLDLEGEVGATITTSPSEPTPEAQLSVAQQSLAELDERELAVLRLTGAFHPGRVSPGAMQELADQLGTTPENLRQIRHRAYNKIDRAYRRRGLPGRSRS